MFENNLDNIIKLIKDINNSEDYHESNFNKGIEVEKQLIENIRNYNQNRIDSL